LFQGASIYWTPETGAHEVHGAIRDKWASLGWEGGALRYPISDEFQDGIYRRTNFQHGYIGWWPQRGAQASVLLQSWKKTRVDWVENTTGLLISAAKEYRTLRRSP